MSTDFFSSLNGKFDLNSSMSNLYGDYNTIKSGAYGSLMKSYVNKVGNKAALNAYRESGTTTTGEVTSSSKKSSASKTNFLDNYFSEKSQNLKKTAKESASSETASSDKTTTSDKYSKYKSSWLDNQLGQYDKDANKTTAADPSVSMDTTI